jgi:hypothetical protein
MTTECDNAGQTHKGGPCAPGVSGNPAGMKVGTRHRATITWATYTLWQFSSEIDCSAQGTCLYNVPGTRFDMDVNVFFGTPEGLKAQWPFTRILKAVAVLHHQVAEVAELRLLALALTVEPAIRVGP